MENLVINYIIISTTAKILNIHHSKIKAIIGASIGALYSLAYLFPTFEILFTIPFKILTVILITLITFSYKDIKSYIRVLSIFYLVNMFISGSTFFIIYFTGISHITVSLVIFVCFVSSKILNLIYKDIKTHKMIKELRKKINVKVKDNVFDFEALLDSGNLLKDPISKDDVIIVNAKKLEKLLPKELVDYDYGDMSFEKMNNLLDKLDINLSSRVRLIPCRKIGNDNGFVLGIKADYIEVDGSKISSIVLGLSNFSDKDDYDAIMNPCVCNV